MDGIVVVNKPEGFTSFDVCKKLRGVFGTRKIGHAGTLDPMATGVLPVLIGKATKASDILPDDKKTYLAGFKFGIKTTTEDIWGEVIKREKSRVLMPQLLVKAKEFKGEILQTPPMYSAVQINGKRLYELARKGIEVERPKRKVTIHSIEILDFDESAQSGTLRAVCSRGTYIRTLISDIAVSLSTVGVMTSLCRERSGGFSLEKALTLDEIQKLKEDGKLNEAVIPPDRAFYCYESIALDQKLTRLYKNGVVLRASQVKKLSTETARVYGFDGEFLGLCRLDESRDKVYQFKNFY